MIVMSSAMTSSDQRGNAETVPNCASALSIAKPTATQRAQLAAANRPQAVRIMNTPRTSVIQPQAVESQNGTPRAPPTVTTSSLRIPASPNITAKQPLISRTTPANTAQPLSGASVEGPEGADVIGDGEGGVVLMAIENPPPGAGG